MRVRSRWCRLASLALVAPLVLVAAAPHSTAEAREPFVHTLAPMPGALVETGMTELRARLWSEADVERVEVSVGGAPVVALTVGSDDPVSGSEVRAEVDLPAGAHTALVAFTDTAGRRTERLWSFTATERRNHRIAGADRIDTAVALSRATFPGGGAVNAAVVARADDFADALAGVPLAADLDAPLLLSRRDRLPDTTAAELRRVLAPGATVHLLGGLAALSDEVRHAVEALGLRAVRHGGADRFATAATVAGLLRAAPEVLLASGVAFPDALAASAPAGRDGLPVLLTDPARLPDATAAALAELAPARVTVVGGGAAVGEAVERRVGNLASEVRRIAGADRYATAVAVLETFYDAPASVSLASGVDFPDALAGARHATALGQPLLLTDPGALSGAAAAALRRHQPSQITVYGGTAAISDTAARTAVRVAEDGDDAPRMVATRPAARSTVRDLRELTVEFDRAVDAARSHLYVEVGGAELRGMTEQRSATSLVFRALADQPEPPLDVAHRVQVAIRASDTQGRLSHDESTFTYLKPDPVFATAGPIALHLPSRDVEMVAFHEANHPGAQQQTARNTATPKITLPSRRRGTGSRTAADIVAHPDEPVLAPVSGRVVRAGSYVLYCRYRDNYAVIDPDDRPGWEVKVLHFHGLRVAAGDRVVADHTVLGAGPRVLPFRSQVDAYTHPRNWPHVHVEVVDPSIPTRPGGGC